MLKSILKSKLLLAIMLVALCTPVIANAGDTLFSSSKCGHSRWFVIIDSQPHCECNGRIIYHTESTECVWISEHFLIAQKVNGKYVHPDDHSVEGYKTLDSGADYRNFTDTVSNLCPGEYIVGILSYIEIDEQPQVGFCASFTLEGDRVMQNVVAHAIGNKCDVDKKIEVSNLKGTPPFKFKKCGTDEVIYTTSDTSCELRATEILALIGDGGSNSVCFDIENSDNPPCFTTKEVEFDGYPMSIELYANKAPCFADRDTSGKIWVGGYTTPPKIDTSLYNILWYDAEGNHLSQFDNLDTITGIPTNTTFKCIVRLKEYPYCESYMNEKQAEQDEPFEYFYEVVRPCLASDGGTVNITITNTGGKTIFIYDREDPFGYPRVARREMAAYGEPGTVFSFDTLKPGHTYCFHLTNTINERYEYLCEDSFCVTIPEAYEDIFVTLDEVVQPDPCVYDSTSTGTATFCVNVPLDEFAIEQRNSVGNIDMKPTILNPGTSEEKVCYTLTGLEAGHYWFQISTTRADSLCNVSDIIEFDIGIKADLSASIGNVRNITGKDEVVAEIRSGNRPEFIWEVEIFDCDEYQKDPSNAVPIEVISQTTDKLGTVFVYPKNLACECFRFTVYDNSRRDDYCSVIAEHCDMSIIDIRARVDRRLLKLDILYTANSMPPIEGFIITNSIGNIVTTDGASIGPIKGVTQQHSINLGNIAAGVYSIVAIGPNNVPISDVYQFIIQ